MGYNLSLSSVDKVTGFLDSLKNTKESVLSWRSKNPKQLQYQIHCGLKAAEALEIPEYKHLCNEWRIREMKGIVVASRKDSNLMKIEAELLVDEVSDVYDIITNLIKHKEILDSQPIIFKEIYLDDEAKEKLKSYCMKNDLVTQIDRGEIRVRRT